MKHNLQTWCGLPLSLVGRIHLIKRNILPRLLYVFQMLPIRVGKKALADLNISIISFIWAKKRPRLRYSVLCYPVKAGGLAAPCFSTYLLTAQTRFLFEWFINDPDSIWIGCEAATLHGIPLSNLLYMSPAKIRGLIRGNIILRNMVNVMRRIRKREGYGSRFSLLTPLHDNLISS